MVMKFTYVGMRNTVPGYKTKKFHGMEKVEITHGRVFMFYLSHLDTVETLYQRKLAMLKSYEEFGI